MKINKKKEFIKSEPAKSKARPLTSADFNLHVKLDEMFPEISTIKKKTPDTPAPENNKMNYLENVKKPTIQPVKSQDNSLKVAENKADEFNYLDVNFQMSKMISRWDEYTNTYKLLYGDDIYNKMYVFPNYNYQYFDMLDEKYEQEQYEMETAEQNDSYDDLLSDYYICDKYDI
jgi:hypothetical protein